MMVKSTQAYWIVCRLELTYDRTSVSLLMGIDVLSYCTRTDTDTYSPKCSHLFIVTSLKSFSDTMRSSGRVPSVK